jgi:hypothetical protein
MLRLHRSQHGIAMVTVMLVATVLTLLFVAAVGYAIQSQPLSRRDQDWNAALAAAQAGVDDYTYRLQQNDTYRSYPDTDPPSPPNPAFTGWQDVPGPANEGQFHYSAVDQTAVDGSVVLTSTGRVRNVTRTVRVTFRRRNFFDYVYFTDYETSDPKLRNGSRSTCEMYWYRGRDDGVCGHINFITDDTITGPLHTNDAFWVLGNPKFLGPVTTAWSETNGCTERPNLNFRWWPLNDCGDRPEFRREGDPAVAPNLDLPDTNSKLRTQADPPNTGCLYTGPTRITLNPAGTMKVESPLTAAGPGVNCPVGDNVPLPTNGVVYVRAVPTGETVSCPQGGGNWLGYPIEEDDTRRPDYDCNNGDVFVSGTLRGRLTIGADHDVVVVDDLSYVGGTGGKDILGLIATEYVWVYHPVNSFGQNLTNLEDLTINAAILALNGSFVVENSDKGATLGTLNVTGAIAQQWRGIVGRSNLSGDPLHGYSKNYVWDQRLQYDSPPHAFDELDTAFQPKLWAETKAPPPCPPTPPGSPCLPP